MKKILPLFIALMVSAITLHARVYVNGYYKNNGTYVAPYVRSSPDGNPYNNYSYPGNTNPYTGKTATGNPDTYLNNYYNKSSSNIYTPSYPAPDNLRTYVNDNSGHPNYYIVYYDDFPPLTRYRIYSLSNEYMGRVSIFPDGSKIMFDAHDNTVKP